MPFFGCSAYRTIVLLPGIKGVPSVVEVQSLNHTTREARCALLMGMQTKHWRFLKKVKDGTSIRPSHSTSGRLFTGYRTKTSKRYLHPYTDCSFIHNSRGVETT